MIGFDVVHVAAAAFWLGGIAGLVVAFRSAAAPERVGRMVARFSAAAVVSVVILAAAGLGMSWIVLPSWGDLVSTGYGLALLTKVVLVAVVVVLGAFNNRRLVPAISAGAAASPVQRRQLLADRAGRAGHAPRRRRRHRRARRPVARDVELGRPAADDRARRRRRGPAVRGCRHASPTPIAPGRAGSNELRLVLTDAAGQPLVPVEAPTVELTEPALELGPLRPLVHPLDVGEYHVIAEIPIAGSWELTVRVRISDFEAATATAVLSIAP